MLASGEEPAFQVEGLLATPMEPILAPHEGQVLGRSRSSDRRKRMTPLGRTSPFRGEGGNDR
jgi:hypothetical protein